MLELRTFGGLAIKENGVPLSGAAVQRKTLALLALLAAAGRKGLSRDKLVVYLWPERDTDHARHLLKQACYALRHDLKEPALLIGATELRLNPAVISSDVQAFEEALDGGDLAAAVRVYTGPFLDGFYLDGAGEFERWVEAERTRILHRVCGALESIAGQAAARGDARAAAEYLRRFTQLDPLSSHAALGLMNTLVVLGERAEAIQHGLAHAALVRRELDAAPPSAVRELIERLREQSGERAPPPHPDQRLLAVVPASTPAQSRGRRLFPVAPLILAVVGAASMLVFWPRSPPQAGLRVEEPRTMLVVLPFENLGPPEDEYFADGLSEAITTRLGALGSLGVIARQSSMEYKHAKKSLRQIGNELGVQYLVTGTVRWDRPGDAVNRILVTPVLVRVSDGAQVWAAQYDTTLAAVFSIQSAIAEQVAGALEIVLDRPAQQALEEQPTRNLAAYDAFLRGQELLERGWDPVELKNAASLLRRAVALDSGFRPALTQLVRVDLDIHINYVDRTEAPVREAKTAVGRVLRLGPDRPEARWALGIYYLLGDDHDPRRAMEQFLRLAQMRPNFPPRGLADASRRAGRWEDALMYYRRVTRLSPRSPRDVGSAGDTYLELRRFREAISAYDRVLQVNPQSAGPTLDRALAYLGQTGDLRGTQRLLPDVSLNIAPTGVEFQVLTLADLVTLLDAHEKALVLKLTPAALDGDTAAVALARAMVHRVRGDSGLAQAYFDSARSVLQESLVRESDAYGRLHCMLGIALAGLGRADDAIRTTKRATEIMPLSRDAMEGPLMLASLARVYLILGRPDEAIDQLKLVLSRPGPLSRGWLRSDPFWDPLRRHPRFRRLLSEASQLGPVDARRWVAP